MAAAAEEQAEEAEEEQAMAQEQVGAGIQPPSTHPCPCLLVHLAEADQMDSLAVTLRAAKDITAGQEDPMFTLNMEGSMATATVNIHTTPRSATAAATACTSANRADSVWEATAGQASLAAAWAAGWVSGANNRAHLETSPRRRCP